MRKFKITVDGKSYDVVVEDTSAGAASIPVATIAAPMTAAPIAAPAAAPQPSTPRPSNSASGDDVGSPLAGVVVSIPVKIGDAVNEGTDVIILEAMKMNTPIRAPKSGLISAIHVTQGQNVSEGQTLVSIE